MLDSHDSRIQLWTRADTYILSVSVVDWRARSNLASLVALKYATPKGSVVNRAKSWWRHEASGTLGRGPPES